MKSNCLFGILTNQGNGPGEYGSISSMTLDPEAGLVYIASGKKIMVYTKEGKFLEEKSFRMFVNYVELVKQTPFILKEEIGIPLENGFDQGHFLFCQKCGISRCDY